MRYIILGFFALVIYWLTFVALPSEEDPRALFTILYLDILLATGFVGCCWKYWGKKRQFGEKIGRMLIIQIGMGMVFLGGYFGFTGNYILTSMSHRTALVAEVNNFLGGHIHPLIPAVVWIILGGYIASFGFKGWKIT